MKTISTIVLLILMQGIALGGEYKFEVRNESSKTVCILAELFLGTERSPVKLNPGSINKYHQEAWWIFQSYLSYVTMVPVDKNGGNCRKTTGKWVTCVHNGRYYGSTITIKNKDQKGKKYDLTCEVKWE